MPGDGRARAREERKRERERARAEKAERAMRGKSLAARIRATERETARRAASARAARRRAATVQAAIGFEGISRDGIAMVERGLWAITAEIPDINFRSARDDERKHVWETLCDVYNGFSPDLSVQLTMLNTVEDAGGRYEQVRLPYTSRASEDELVDEYNDMLMAQIARSGSRAIKRGTYITISAAAPDEESASASLHAAMAPVLASLERLGSHARTLDGGEYLALVGSMLRPGEDACYSLADLEASGVDAKDAVCPLDIDFAPDRAGGKNDCWRCGSEPAMAGEGVSTSTWFQALSFREPFPAIVSDSALTDLISLPVPMCLTVHIHPVEPTQAIDKVQKKLSFMKSEQAHQGRRAAREGLDPVASQSISLTQVLSEGEDMLSALSDRDERLFSCYLQACTWARTRGEMEDQAFAIAQRASKKLFRLGVPRWQLRDCMNSMLPFANDYMRSHRFLLTTEVATLQPFVTQEVSERGGIYVGTNKLSGNMVLAARRRLAAPMGWIMAEPGYGKSFAAKQEIFANAIANPQDTVWVIDPKGEYAWITERLGGQVVDLAADSESHINLFDLDTSYRPNATDPMTFKCEFVSSTISTLLGADSLSAREKSCIDTTVMECYRDLGTAAGGGTPTLTTFWHKLRVSEDPVAQDLSYQLDRFVRGSLRTFAYPTNVDTSARIVDVNMKRLSGDLKLFGQLVALDAAWNCVRKNQDRALRTWIYIDEAQNFFGSEAALGYFTKFWSEGRSYGLIPTGITQNIDRVVNHAEARQMLSNSDYILMLQQSANDLRCVQELYGLSDEQCENLRTGVPGEGLLLYGGKVVPFRNRFPRDTRLFELFDTDPNTAEGRGPREVP